MELIILIVWVIVDIGFYAKTPIDFRTQNKWYSILPWGGMLAYYRYRKSPKN